MDKLIAELRRLYFLPDSPLPKLDTGEASPALSFAGAGGQVRALVLGFARAADWDSVARVYRALQEDLKLPAPAVAVSGSAGYQLWFSLCEPLPAERAAVFLSALRHAYVPELGPAYLESWPAGEAKVLTLPPARHASSGKWSAFIDPDLGSLFSEEPGLGMAPAPERQADLLAGLQSIKAGDLERALALLTQGSTADLAGGTELAVVPTDEALAPGQPRLKPGGYFADPKSFLLALMNDSSASTAHRLEAARALLPYFIEGDQRITSCQH